MEKLLDAGVNMLETGMLDTDVVRTLGELGQITSQTYRDVAGQPTQPVGGMFAMWRAMRDPEVQKSMGFAIAFAKAFFQTYPLNPCTNYPLPGASSSSRANT